MKPAQSWVEKYAPQQIKDIVGNTSAIEKITTWLQKWPKSIIRNKRALMIFGPVGVGKTIAIHTIARELGYEVTELNASVKRSKKMMDELLKTSTMTGTLTSTRGRLILVDELTGLSGKSDRGAASSLKEHIQKTRVPMILITNDVSDAKIRPLQKICSLIEFEPVQPMEIVELLKTICQREKIRFEESGLNAIATNSRGDIRGAINDLHSITQTGSIITDKAILDFLKSRDQTIDIQEALDRIFYADTWTQAVIKSNDVDVYPDELLRWVSNNVSFVFPDLAQQVKAFDLLSRASIFSRRISRTQNWRLLPYSRELMCVTSAIIGGTPTSKRYKYKIPEWIMQMAYSRGVRQKRTLIGQILSPIVHLSSKKAYEEYIIVLKALMDNPKTHSALIADLEISEELVQFIKKQ